MQVVLYIMLFQSHALLYCLAVLWQCVRWIGSSVYTHIYVWATCVTLDCCTCDSTVCVVCVRDHIRLEWLVNFCCVLGYVLPEGCYHGLVQLSALHL